MKKKFGKGGTARPVQSYRSADKFSVDEMPPREAARVKDSERSRTEDAEFDARRAQSRYMDALGAIVEESPKTTMQEADRNPVIRNYSKKEAAAEDRAEKTGSDAFRVQKGKKAYQYKKGGAVTRGDGIARKGKTKGRMI